MLGNFLFFIFFDRGAQSDCDRYFYLLIHVSSNFYEENSYDFYMDLLIIS